MTQMDEALLKLDEYAAVLKEHGDAINNLGANVQWIVDNVQGIFQMFNSPQFMSMMPGMLGAAAKGAENGTAEG
jgi:hypothetical protein